MAQSTLPRGVLRVLIAVALVLLVTLLVAVSVVGGLAWLLGAMGDVPGQTVLGGIALACGLLAVIDLIFLVLALAVHSLQPPEEPPDEPS